LGEFRRGRRFSSPPFCVALLGSGILTFEGSASDFMKSSNQLANSRSPYLLQHAENPVHWKEWSESAFAEARDRDVPIFLSIGYSTCHWCHVMAHESFENEKIAAEMNARFVNIKVDREERPDVDRIYMAYVQTLTGSGGWPMSVWLTPDRKPFYGGTYFPPDSRYGRVGFLQLISRISELWAARREELLKQASDYVDTLCVNSAKAGSSSSTLVWEAMDSCYQQLSKEFDEERGGFGGAPKFPMPGYIEFLLEYAEAKGSSGRLEFLVGKTLDEMMMGGIHDHLAGGFHRYSVDRYWHVPHFEKMLYDQGQLASVYSGAFKLLAKMDYLQVALRIISYIGDQLTSEEGGFFSAEDADSPLEEDPSVSREGAFYVWRADALKRRLGDQKFAIFKKAFGIQEEGNVRRESDPHGEFVGTNVLFEAVDLETLSAEGGLDPSETGSQLEQCVQTLKADRDKRPRPHLDDKILASWNGLMISGACHLYQSSGDESSLELAARAGEFVWDRMFDFSTSTLFRAFRESLGETKGFAEDYACLGLAYLDLYESTGSIKWLQRSETLLEQLIDRFWDGDEGGFFGSDDGDASLIVRLKDDYDGAEPSANSLAAIALIKISSILGDDRFADHARETIEAFRTRWSRYPRAMPAMLVAAMRQLRPGQQIVIAGDCGTRTGQQLVRTVYAHRKRHSSIAFLDNESDWLVSRNDRYRDFLRDDVSPIVYVCDNYACKAPASDSEVLKAQLLGQWSQKDYERVRRVENKSFYL